MGGGRLRRAAALVELIVGSCQVEAGAGRLASQKAAVVKHMDLAEVARQLLFRAGSPASLVVAAMIVVVLAVVAPVAVAEAVAAAAALDAIPPCNVASIRRLRRERLLHSCQQIPLGSYGEVFRPVMIREACCVRSDAALTAAPPASSSPPLVVACPPPAWPATSSSSNLRRDAIPKGVRAAAPAHGVDRARLKQVVLESRSDSGPPFPDLVTWMLALAASSPPAAVAHDAPLTLDARNDCWDLSLLWCRG